MKISALWPCLFILLSTTYCGTSNKVSYLHIAPLTSEQKAADFDQLLNQIDAMYAPLQYKEKMFAFDFEILAKEFRIKAIQSKTDDEFYSQITALLAVFQDGHVSVSFPESVSRFIIPIMAIPVEGKVLVGHVDSTLKDEGIKRGDEILLVDGVAPMEYLPLFTKHVRFGNDLSDLHHIERLFKRPSYFSGSLTLKDGRKINALPTHARAKILFRRENNSTYTKDLVWRTQKKKSITTEFVSPNVSTQLHSEQANDLIKRRMNLLHFGVVKPFFINNTTLTEHKIRRVRVDQDDVVTLKKIELDPEKIQQEIYAALYRFEGKTILLIRQPGYTASDIPNSVKTYQAILSQNESLADVLVIDQTHNPGGNSTFLDGFTSLFAVDNFRGSVQFYNADRKWTHELRSYYENEISEKDKENEEGLRVLSIVKDLDDAMEKDQELSSHPYSFTGLNYIYPHKKYTWKKPILVLTDELAGSCGDLFPMMMKRNGRATIFGQRTMGLGGSVEPMEPLTYSRVSVKLTRGLLVDYKENGTYRLESYIENNGITPDVVHEISVNDFRSNFLTYFSEFSKTAISLIDQK